MLVFEPRGGTLPSRAALCMVIEMYVGSEGGGYGVLFNVIDSLS